MADHEDLSTLAASRLLSQQRLNECLTMPVHVEELRMAYDSLVEVLSSSSPLDEKVAQKDDQQKEDKEELYGESVQPSTTSPSLAAANSPSAVPPSAVVLYQYLLYTCQLLLAIDDRSGTTTSTEGRGGQQDENAASDHHHQPSVSSSPSILSSRQRNVIESTCQRCRGILKLLPKETDNETRTASATIPTSSCDDETGPLKLRRVGRTEHHTLGLPLPKKAGWYTWKEKKEDGYSANNMRTVAPPDPEVTSAGINLSWTKDELQAEHDLLCQMAATPIPNEEKAEEASSIRIVSEQEADNTGQQSQVEHHRSPLEQERQGKRLKIVQQEPSPS